MNGCIVEWLNCKEGQWPYRYIAKLLINTPNICSYFLYNKPGNLDIVTFLKYIKNKSRPAYSGAALSFLRTQIIFLEWPDQAKLTEGVHDLSVDINTSFFFGET